MGIVFDPDVPETRKAFQEYARLQMIVRLEKDILMDMEICKIEGWDCMEYINQLRNMLDRLGRKEEP